MKTLILIAVLLLPVMAFAETYQWVDADGITHFSDTPTQGYNVKKRSDVKGLPTTKFVEREDKSHMKVGLTMDEVYGILGGQGEWDSNCSYTMNGEYCQWVRSHGIIYVYTLDGLVTSWQFNLRTRGAY
jgi:hypothetical protein